MLFARENSLLASNNQSETMQGSCRATSSVWNFRVDSQTSLSFVHYSFIFASVTNVCSLAAIEQFLIECRKSFGIALVLLRSVIGSKTCATFSTNQIQNQSRIGRTRFPALGASYVFCFEFSLVHCVVFVCCHWPL